MEKLRLSLPLASARTSDLCDVLACTRGVNFQRRHGSTQTGESSSGSGMANRTEHGLWNPLSSPATC